MNAAVRVVSATAEDTPVILEFIRALAVFEKLEHAVTATEARLRATLFGERPLAEVVFLEADGLKVAFALFFHNYSTFLGQPGLYLEDLFVKEDHRGRGYGKLLLGHLAKLALERECGRFEWSVLDWNESALRFYRSLGAEPMSEWTGQRVTGAALKQLAEHAP